MQLLMTKQHLARHHQMLRRMQCKYLPARSATQRYSEVLRGTQRYSEVLRGHQRSSEEIAPRLGDRRPLDIESAQILTRECVGSVVASCTAFARSGHAQYREA